MQRRLIVTDLTRFSNPDIVCIAAIDSSDGICVRPLPYLATQACRDLNILPGTIISGDFVTAPNLVGPHQEDCSYSNLAFEGQCTSVDFRSLLAASQFTGVEDGFSISLENGQKLIPPSHSVARSIITIEVAPSNIAIVDDRYNPGKIKLNFTDGAGREFRYLPITDLGFHEYAKRNRDQGNLTSVNSHIRSQSQVLLRIGLGRKYAAPDGREGYWLQANGIYTFPDCLIAIRSYT